MARRSARPQRVVSALWNKRLCAGRLEGPQLMRKSLGAHPAFRWRRALQGRQHTGMPQLQKLLFVCSQNRIRSLTAEKLLTGHPLYEVRSAGTDHDARIRVTAEHIGWADQIFVMEKHHQNRLRKKFRNELKGKALVCLNIPDEYEPLGDDLVEILRARLARYLQLSEIGGA
jgi:predicted protein tyrosine phosphatase